MTELPDTTTPKRWRVTMADQAERVIEARGFRVEHGALVLVQPQGCAAAYVLSTWLTKFTTRKDDQWPTLADRPLPEPPPNLPQLKVG